MKRYSFNVPLYDYDVTLVQVDSKDDKSRIEAFLRTQKIDKEYINESCNNIEDNYSDGGHTFYNKGLKSIVVVFYVFTNVESLENVYSHEKRHIEDRILSHCSVDDMEASAYLSGYLGVQFYKFKQMKAK